MAEKSSGDTSNRKMKNPLLCSTVTGLSIDDFIQNAVLLPVHPAEQPAELHDDVQIRPPRTVPATVSASRSHAEIEPSTFRTYRNTADAPTATELGSNLDEIDLTAKENEDDFDIDSFYSRLHATPNLNNAKPEVANEEFSEIDLLSTSSDSRVFEDKENQSMAADLAQNLSQLPNVFPHVASTVFNSFSSIWNMNRSRTEDDRRPAYGASDAAGRNVEIFEESRTGIGEDLTLGGDGLHMEPVPLFDTASFGGVGSRKSSIHASAAKEDAAGGDVVDGKVDDALKETACLDNGRAGQGVTDGGAANRYRLGSKKKKTYAHVPGLVLGETEYQYHKPQPPITGLPPIPPLPSNAPMNISAYNHGQPSVLDPSMLPNTAVELTPLAASASNVNVSYQNVIDFSNGHGLKEDTGNNTLQPFVVESNLFSEPKIDYFSTESVNTNVVFASKSMTGRVHDVVSTETDMCRVVDETPTEDNIVKLPTFAAVNKTSNFLPVTRDSLTEKEPTNNDEQHLQAEQNAAKPIFFDPQACSNVTMVPTSQLPPQGNAYRASSSAYGQKSNLSVKNFYSLLKKNSPLTGTNQGTSTDAVHNLNHSYNITAFSDVRPVAIFNPLATLEPSNGATAVANSSSHQTQSAVSFSESAILNQNAVNPPTECSNQSSVIATPLFFNPESCRESSNNVLTPETQVLNYAPDALQPDVSNLPSENPQESAVQDVDVQQPMFFNPSSLPQSYSLPQLASNSVQSNLNSSVSLPQVQVGLQSHESPSVSSILKPPSNLPVPFGSPLSSTPPVAPPAAFSNSAESGNRFRLSNNKKRLQYYSGPVDTSVQTQNASTPVQTVPFQSLQESQASVSLLTPSNENYANLPSNYAPSVPLENAYASNTYANFSHDLSGSNEQLTGLNQQYDSLLYQVPNPHESNESSFKSPSSFLGFATLGKIQEKVNLNNLQKAVTSFFDANYYEQKEKEDKQFKESHKTSEQPNDSVVHGSHLQDAFVQQSFEYESSQAAPLFYNPNQFDQSYSETGNQYCNNASEDLVKIQSPQQPANDFYEKSVTSNQFQHFSDVQSYNTNDLAQQIPKVPPQRILPPAINFFNNFTGSSFVDNDSVVEDSSKPTNNDFNEANAHGNPTLYQTDVRRKSMSPRTASYESDPFFLEGPQAKVYRHFEEHGEMKNDENTSIETLSSREPCASGFGHDTAEEFSVHQAGLQMSANLREDNDAGRGYIDLWNHSEAFQRNDGRGGVEVLNSNISLEDVNKNKQDVTDRVDEEKTMTGVSRDVAIPEFPSFPDDNQNVVARSQHIWDTVDRLDNYRPEAQAYPTQNVNNIEEENTSGIQNPVHPKKKWLVEDKATIDPQYEDFQSSLESQFRPPHLTADSRSNVYDERNRGGQERSDALIEERRIENDEAEHSKLSEVDETNTGVNEIEMLTQETPQKVPENQPTIKPSDSSTVARNNAYERQLHERLTHDRFESRAANQFFDSLSLEGNIDETQQGKVQSMQEDAMVTRMMQQDEEQVDQIIGTFKNIVVKEVQGITPNREIPPHENNLMYTIEPIGVDSEDEDRVYENVPINGTEPSGRQVDALNSYFPESQFDPNSVSSNNHFHQSVLNRVHPPSLDQQLAAFVPIRTVSPRTSASGLLTEQNASAPSGDDSNLRQSSSQQRSMYDYPKTWADEHLRSTDSFGIPLAYIQQQLPYNPSTANLDSGINEMYSTSLPPSSQEAQDGSSSSQNLELQRNISVSLQVVRGRSKSSSSDNDEGNFLRVTAEEEFLPTKDAQSKNEHTENINVALFMQPPVAIPSFFDTDSNEKTMERLPDNDLVEEKKHTFEEDFTNDFGKDVIEEILSNNDDSIKETDSKAQFYSTQEAESNSEGLKDYSNTTVHATEVLSTDVKYELDDTKINTTVIAEESRCFEKPVCDQQCDDVFKDEQVENVQEIDLIDRALNDGVENGSENVEIGIHAACHDTISSINESATHGEELNVKDIPSLCVDNDIVEISIEKKAEGENLANKPFIDFFENTIPKDYQSEDVPSDVRAGTEDYCTNTTCDTGLLESPNPAGHAWDSNADSEINLFKNTDSNVQDLFDSVSQQANNTTDISQGLEDIPAVSNIDVSSKNQTEQNSVPLFNAFSFGFDNQQSFFNDFGGDSDKKSKNTNFTSSKRHDDNLLQSFYTKKDDTRPVGVAQPYLYNNQTQSPSQIFQTVNRTPAPSNVTNTTYFYPVTVSNRPSFANEQNYHYGNVQYQNQAQQPEFYMVRHAPIISNQFQAQPEMMQNQFLHYQQQQQQGANQTVAQSNYNQNLPFNSNPIPSVYDQIPANSNQVQRNNNFSFPNANDTKNCRQYFN